ncbi:hypothetical protein CsatB_001542 [Cannabis sativa]
MVVTKPEGEKEIQVQILIMLCYRKESRARDLEWKGSLYSAAFNVYGSLDTSRYILYVVCNLESSFLG